MVAAKQWSFPSLSAPLGIGPAIFDSSISQICSVMVNLGSRASYMCRRWGPLPIKLGNTLPIRA
jgi:hypothetical protein